VTVAAAARAAARRFGTPLYLYDLARLRASAREVAAAFADPWLRLYSMKANPLPAIVAEVAAAGFGVSAVSGGELALARAGGVAPSATALEGIGKTAADLAVAVRLAASGTPLLWVSLESADEAAALAVEARRAGVRSVDVLVRVNPSVLPETISGLAVGAAASKFGVLAEELPAVIAAGGGPAGPLRWRGVHLHIGSQLGAVDGWRSAFRIGLRVLSLQRAQLTDFDTLDAGGGFPVAFDEPASVPAAARFAEAVEAELAAVPVSTRPARLAIEPGRALVADSGWIVASVLHVRQREPAIVVLDAGMTELIRPALYGAEHPLLALTSLGEPVDGTADAATTVAVHGPICESTDRLGSARLPPLMRGDLVAIGVTGAYASSMFSSYNGRRRPPEIGWDGRRLTRLDRARRVPATAC
jgi:diaminopimelate decarboxylase